jgi:hypothetical protein
MTPKALGLDLLSGRAGPAWQQRYRAACQLNAALVGEPGDDLPRGAALEARSLDGKTGGRGPHASVAPGPATLRGVGARALGAPRPRGIDRPLPATRLAHDASRAEVVRLGAALVEAAVAAAPIDALLGPEVLVAWSDGALALHPREALATRGAAVARPLGGLDLDTPRASTLVELRTNLPRGVADALDAALGLDDAVVLSFAPARRASRRVMLVARPGRTRGAADPHAWALSSLALPAVDEALVASDRSSYHETPHLATALRVVRTIVYGHGHRFRAAANELFPRVWLGDQRLEPGELADVVQRAPIGPARLELVLSSAAEVEWRALAAKLPRAVVERLERHGPEELGDQLARLRPRCVEVGLARLDAARGDTTPLEPARALLVTGPDGRARVAAVALPPLVGL